MYIYIYILHIYIYIYICVCVCIFAFLLLIQAVGCGDGWKSFQEQDILSQGHIYNKCSDRIICVTSSPFRKLWRTYQRTDRLLVNYTSNNISWKEGIWILRMIWILWNYVFFQNYFALLIGTEKKEKENFLMDRTNSQG